MPSRLPVWIMVLLGLQLALALFFFAFGWSMTSSIRLGRTLSLEDTVYLASPALGVVLCGMLASLLWRREQHTVAMIVAFAPIPLALAMLVLSGAVI